MGISRNTVLVELNIAVLCEDHVVLRRLLKQSEPVSVGLENDLIRRSSDRDGYDTSADGNCGCAGVVGVDFLADDFARLPVVRLG
jgi:hypothetical protein